MTELLGEEDEQVGDALRVTGIANYKLGQLQNDKSRSKIGMEQLQKACEILENC